MRRSERLHDLNDSSRRGTQTPESPEVQSQDIVVDWNSPRDPDNPFNWPVWKKWMVTLTACFICFIVGINGTAIASAAEAINEEFHVSDERFPNSYWAVTSWNLGAAVVPLVGLPLMENFGVRYAYLTLYIVFIVFIIPQAVAPNYATLIVTRTFSGACAGVLENIAGGIVTDIWGREQERGFPMSLYIWSLLAGVTIGPVIGGAIIHYLNWRWIFYVQLVLYGIFFLLPLFCLSESRGLVILKCRANRIRKQTEKECYAQAEYKPPKIGQLIKEAVVRPLHMLITEWVVFSCTMWSAFCFGTAFLSTQSVPQVYRENYAWSPFLTGSVQSSIVIGETLGLFASVPQDRLYFRSARRNKECQGQPIPEARLYLSIVGSFLGLMGGFFWYGLASDPNLHWILPTVGLAFIGFGIFTVVSAVSNYITDSYAKFAASGLAGVAFGENVFAAFLPLATQSMYTELGFKWASCTLGFIALVLSLAPVVLLIRGKSVRDKSPFMREASRS